VLNLAVREGHKGVRFQKVKDAGAQQVGHNADVTTIIEAVSQVYTLVAVLSVVGLER
jgi:hypothetical protein